VFVYDKQDDPTTLSATLDIKHTIFVQREHTADFQTTTRVRAIVENEGNVDDLVGYMRDINLPVDEIEAQEIAEAILQTPPPIGYLTISNALQWRLQYSRVIQKAGSVEGVTRLG
jgi:ABC-type phosphate transport system substrate-binding protein